MAGALERPATPPPAAAAAVPGDTPPWRLSAAPGPSALTSLRDIQSQEAAAGAQVLVPCVFTGLPACPPSSSVSCRRTDVHGLSMLPSCDCWHAHGQALITPPTDGLTGSHYAAEVGTAARAQTSADGGSMMVPLTQLLKKSAPIDMGAACADARSAARCKRPPWAGVEGASPPPSGMQPSLRTIQVCTLARPFAWSNSWMRMQALAGDLEHPRRDTLGVGDGQAEQQQLRESMSRSWGAAGASPGSRGSHHVISSWCTSAPCPCGSYLKPAGSTAGVVRPCA
jgi:hypothetical protein